MPKTCETCRFWAQDYNTDFGTCRSAKIFYDHYDGDLETEPQKTNELAYSDHENYAAWHRVGKDFGCIHHAARHLSTKGEPGTK